MRNAKNAHTLTHSLIGKNTEQKRIMQFATEFHLRWAYSNGYEPNRIMSFSFRSAATINQIARRLFQMMHRLTEN